MYTPWSLGGPRRSVTCFIGMPISSRVKRLLAAGLPVISPSQPSRPFTLRPSPATTLDESTTSPRAFTPLLAAGALAAGAGAGAGAGAAVVAGAGAGAGAGLPVISLTWAQPAPSRAEAHSADRMAREVAFFMASPGDRFWTARIVNQFPVLHPPRRSVLSGSIQQSSGHSPGPARLGSLLYL